jgi:hypothetical protein
MKKFYKVNPKSKSNDGIVKKMKVNKKMSPYSKDEESKWVLNNNIPSSMKTKNKKEEVKNANRSLKKGVRQEMKKDLQRQVNKFFE